MTPLDTAIEALEEIVRLSEASDEPNIFEEVAREALNEIAREKALAL